MRCSPRLPPAEGRKRRKKLDNYSGLRTIMNGGSEYIVGNTSNQPFVAKEFKMTTATAKRITLATIKAFICKAGKSLLISTRSRFDGMEDGVRDCGDGSFTLAMISDHPCRNDLGIQGAWFVMGSRDHFQFYSKDGLAGFEVTNSCGKFILAVRE